ncbi:hypothetical protein ncot_12640 [Nocardioides sp. JQ2195]|uniref:Gmad2 immunoglobulin-like domain-containing protein n=1 Tax=Nocardioides sp. JQ2195 TaxID=2592334 RepID=UPI00143E28B4|nr:Gmad2 immunoglobulin-like domain-containing protein [Nocardioides sp. JQ2195]QIX27355.1 hypothetical protein ncot_12640 [Nocardioides sp. JQ2195]
MNRPENNDPLRELLSDAVSDIEPDDALGSIRERTRASSTTSRRPWLYGAGGAVIATAATITAIALAGNLGNDDSADPGPAVSPDGRTSGTTDGPSDDGADYVLPVYYVGDGPDGPRLFREFHPKHAAGGAELRLAVDEAVSGSPFDPDYRNPWPEGTAVGSASYDGDVITVDLSTSGPSLRRRPAGMTATEASFAVEQVIFTAQAAAGDGRRPVRLLVDGKQSDTVLGEPAAEPLSNDTVTEVLSLMSITAPREGVEVSGMFTATGVNNGFEAWVGWQLVDATGAVVKDGFGTAAGAAETNRLFPWRIEVDLAGVAPGRYTFRAYNDDPSGGAEGAGPAEDTRTIIVP